MRRQGDRSVAAHLGSHVVGRDEHDMARRRPERDAEGKEGGGEGEG